MASPYDNGPPPEHVHGDDPYAHPRDYPDPDMRYNDDRNWQNGGQKTPDSGYRLRPTGSAPTTPNPPPPGWDEEPRPRKSGERNRSRQRSGQGRTCKKCGEPLTGQFVRALDGTFHLDCFKCQVDIHTPHLLFGVESS